jgi:hypothetical protein
LEEGVLRDLSIFGEVPGVTNTIPPETSGAGPFTFWLLVQPQWGLTKDISAYVSSTNLKAVIDGPYGGHHRVGRYGHVVMFAQGIGIAAQIPYMRDFFYGSLRGRLPVRRISLIWETRESKFNVPVSKMPCANTLKFIA